MRCLSRDCETPRSARLLFKDPCVRLASEVNTTLTELASSIRNRRHCSPEILTERLQQALQNLNTALKSQPRLFLGPNCPNNTSNMLALVARQKSLKHLSSMKTTDSPKKSGLKTDSPKKSNMKTDSPRISKGGTEAEKRVLRPTLSKLTITSLEFSEALPFAAFVALLVELVARLDLVIEEVEELGRVACFREFKRGDDVILDVDRRTSTEINVPNAAAAE